MPAVPGIDRRYRHLGRYRKIIEVLLRNGFGYLVEQVDLTHLVPLPRRLLPQPEAARCNLGVRLRSAFEELGPTYVKLGQLLSTRTDLLPQDVIAELSKLQDRVAPFDAESAVAQIEQEIGRSLADIFSSFERQPMAAASIGQVHVATLHSGERVVVKVQRPGVAPIVAVDVEILQGLAKRAQDYLRLSVVDLNELVREFARNIKRELDYTVEAHNTDRFQRNFSRDPTIHIPRIFWELTTQRVLTMEFIDGHRLQHLPPEEEGGPKRSELARRGAQAFLKQVMVDGFFHADPHPGNILVEADGRIAFIDFGIVGRLDPSTVDLLADMFLGLTQRRSDEVVKALRGICVVDTNIDLNALSRDIEELVERYYGKALRDLNFGVLLNEIMLLAYRYRIRVPDDFLLLARALLTMEGVGRSLDPQFDIVEVAEPFALYLMHRRLDPRRLARRGSQSLWDYSRLLADIPRQMTAVLRQLEKGDLAIQFRHIGLESLISRLDVASNRLSVALVVAALIIGSALILATEKGPVLFQMPLLGVVGFVIAAVTGLWLVIAVLRSGRL